jgi:hypothetical protein
MQLLPEKGNTPGKYKVRVCVPKYRIVKTRKRKLTK